MQSKNEAMLHQQIKGRLGNVCYQAATAIAYALDHDIPFTLSSTTKDPVMQPLYFQHLVKPLPDLPAVWYREMQHNYEPLRWEEDWRSKNIMMDGFWQSFRYFEHRRKEVIEALRIKRYPEMSGYVAVHVRRGDYLTIPGKHILNTDGDFMVQALEHFGDEYRYAIFSDDMAWCRTYFGPDVMYIEGNDPLTDLGLLSSCRHFINSSSTFSAFGAWLGEAEDKIVITPREWFQSTQPENTIDIIPETWIKL